MDIHLVLKGLLLSFKVAQTLIIEILKDNLKSLFYSGFESKVSYWLEDS